MNGSKKHNPKVCNKLLTNGVRGSQGCNGKVCEKHHPKMCYSSMNTKVCRKEKCTYWHCKGTSFSPESTARYQAPSRHSLGQFPSLPARRGRSPGRGREQEERGRPNYREEEQERRKQEDDQERRRRDEEQERGRRERRGREEPKKDEAANFLEMAQLIRLEVQRAFQALLPLPAASGSAASLPRTPGRQFQIGQRCLARSGPTEV